MSKIVILGPSGTGKTTLARRLANKLHIKALHLDSIYWKKDWQHISKEKFDQYMKQFLTKNGSWVIDGNYLSHQHFYYRLQLATTIIFLDYEIPSALKGIYQRAKEYKHRSRNDMAEGCIEGVDQEFLQYVTFFKPTAYKIKALINQYKSRKQILIFKNRTELQKWEQSL